LLGSREGVSVFFDVVRKTSFRVPSSSIATTSSTLCTAYAAADAAHANQTPESGEETYLGELLEAVRKVPNGVGLPTLLRDVLRANDHSKASLALGQSTTVYGWHLSVSRGERRLRIEVENRTSMSAPMPDIFLDCTTQAGRELRTVTPPTRRPPTMLAGGTRYVAEEEVPGSLCVAPFLLIQPRDPVTLKPSLRLWSLS
jgi:hypothetical protein